MNADDILFDPIHKPAVKPPIESGITRRAEAISVEIRATIPRSVYMDAAHEVMDSVVKHHSLPNVLVDVRTATFQPRGALDLLGLVTRFHDGNEEIWVSCPQHMPPDLIRFQGRFGFKKSCKMPKKHGSFGFVYWSWVDTNAGELPGIDLGIIMVPIGDRWYRVFASKSDARDYYQS